MVVRIEKDKPAARKPDPNLTELTVASGTTRAIIANDEMRIIKPGETIEENIKRLGPMGPRIPLK